MRKASTVEEDYDREWVDRGGSCVFFRVHDDGGSCRDDGARTVDPAKKVGGSVNEYVKGIYSIDRSIIGRHFAVEKLRQVAVEAAIGAAEKIVG